MGNQHFKVGGEIFRTMATEIWQRAYPGDVLHVLQNRYAYRSVHIRDAFEIREWIVDIFCLRQRLLAGEQSLDAESGSPIRPLSPVSPRADTPAWLVQQDLAAVPAHICDAEQLRKCSGPGRARRHTPHGQQHDSRRARGKRASRSVDTAAWRGSSTSSICSTPIRSRTRAGRPARPSCGRSASRRRSSRGSVPSWNGDSKADGVSGEQPRSVGRREAPPFPGSSAGAPHVAAP